MIRILPRKFPLQAKMLPSPLLKRSSIPEPFSTNLPRIENQAQKSPQELADFLCAIIPISVSQLTTPQSLFHLDRLREKKDLILQMCCEAVLEKFPHLQANFSKPHALPATVQVNLFYLSALADSAHDLTLLHTILLKCQMPANDAFTNALRAQMKSMAEGIAATLAAPVTQAPVAASEPPKGFFSDETLAMVTAIPKKNNRVIWVSGILLGLGSAGLAWLFTPEIVAKLPQWGFKLEKPSDGIFAQYFIPIFAATTAVCFFNPLFTLPFFSTFIRRFRPLTFFVTDLCGEMVSLNRAYEKLQHILFELRHRPELIRQELNQAAGQNLRDIEEALDHAHTLFKKVTVDQDLPWGISQSQNKLARLRRECKTLITALEPVLSVIPPTPPQ